MKFECTAYDRAGKRIEQVLDAASPREAEDELARKGLFVTDVRRLRSTVQLKGGTHARTGIDLSALSGSKRARNLAMFCRQLSVLTSTGTPLVEALHAIARQTPDPRFSSVVDAVRSHVEEGGTLSDALRKHPDQFDAVAVSLVAAGESGGGLDEMLGRLARLTRQQHVVRAQIAGAMVYPVLLVTIALIVLAIMIVFVIPRFEGMFESLDAPLPGSTKFLMDISEAIRAYWWAIIPAALAALGGAVAFMLTPSGRDALDTLAVKLPKLGEITRSMAMGRIARVLGVLMTSRVPMLEALELTERAMTNRHYRLLVASVHAGVTDGDAMSAVIARSTLVTPAFTEAVRNGERSGKLGEVLTAMADYIDEDNAIAVKSISSIIEPVILIALGVLVGFVAISMFMPLFDVTSAVSPAGGTP